MKQVIRIEVTTHVQWQVERGPSRHYVATCPALGLVMEDPTFEGLEASIEESVQLLMRDLLESNELESFLRQRGWRAMPQPPVHDGPNDVQFDVPYELLVRASRDSARSLLQ